MAAAEEQNMRRRPWTVTDKRTVTMGGRSRRFVRSAGAASAPDMDEVRQEAGDALARRVCFIQEQHISEFEAKDEPSYIERIEFGPPDPKALGQKPPLVMVVNRAAG